MMDLTPNKVFKSSAFEPTDEELTNHARAKRRGRREASKRVVSKRVVSKRVPSGDVKMRSPSPKPMALEDRAADDSDDDLPDVTRMFDERPQKRRKRSTMDDVSPLFCL
jgi:hypothetical protein